MGTVLLPLAPGFEEIEALTVVDILRRGEVNIVMAGTVDGPIEGRSKVKVLPDTLLDNINPDDLDMIILPGGQPGTDNLKSDERVKNIIEVLRKKHKYIAAICAAPTVLSAMGILSDKKATSFPGVKDQLKVKEYSEDRVVVDGNIITGRSAGTAMEFAMKLLEILRSKDAMEKVNEGVLAKL